MTGLNDKDGKRVWGVASRATGNFKDHSHGPRVQVSGIDCTDGSRKSLFLEPSHASVRIAAPLRHASCRAARRPGLLIFAHDSAHR